MMSQLKSHWTPCCCWNMLPLLLPQGLYLCCFLHLPGSSFRHCCLIRYTVSSFTSPDLYSVLPSYWDFLWSPIPNRPSDTLTSLPCSTFFFHIDNYLKNLVSILFIGLVPGLSPPLEYKLHEAMYLNLHCSQLYLSNLNISQHVTAIPHNCWMNGWMGGCFSSMTLRLNCPGMNPHSASTCYICDLWEII